jgi:hypothetical protein
MQGKLRLFLRSIRIEDRQAGRVHLLMQPEAFTPALLFTVYRSSGIISLKSRKE